MEHRNSTVVAAPVSLRMPGMVADVLDTVSHEFFHAWNVERIRPKTLEPFNFEEANISGELWLAEGFTQYYGKLIMGRAGLVDARRDRRRRWRGAAVTVINGPGRQFRSAVADEPDGAVHRRRARGRPDQFHDHASFRTTPTAAAVALALDLSLRDRSNGKVSLDDYMRAMWRVHGKPGGPQPGLVAKPYTLADARARLAEVSGDGRSPMSSSTRTSKGARRCRLRAPAAARGICAAEAQSGCGVAAGLSPTATGRSTT